LLLSNTLHKALQLTTHHCLREQLPSPLTVHCSAFCFFSNLHSSEFITFNEWVFITVWKYCTELSMDGTSNIAHVPEGWLLPYSFLAWENYLITSIISMIYIETNTFFCQNKWRIILWQEWFKDLSLHILYWYPSIIKSQWCRLPVQLSL